MTRRRDAYQVSAQAQRDLIELRRETLRGFGPERAAANAAALVAAFERLATLPLSAPARPDLSRANPPVRSLTFQRRLLVVNSVGVEQITILRVMDGRRDIATSMRDSDPA